MHIKMPMLALTPHGGGRVLVEIANAMVRRGDSVTVIVSNYRASMPFVFDDRVVIKKIGPRSSSKLVCLVMFMLLSPFYMLRSDIIANHFLTVLPSWLSQISGSRYIYLVQDIEHRFFTKARLWPLRVLCRWTYHRGKLVAANAYLASQLVRYKEVLMTLRLGVSRSFFTEQNGVLEKRFDVVYFLRSQPHKRLDRFDEILKKFSVRGISVLCISQDLFLLKKYEAMVTTCVPANDTELIAAIDSAKILLLTSEHEGFALPPLEGMARGLPAVMYECGGPGVYSRHGVNAFIVEVGNNQKIPSNAIVDHIEYLLQSDSEYARMAANAREVATEFRLDVAVDEFIAYLERYFDSET